jgi:hypothetical protein
LCVYNFEKQMADINAAIIGFAGVLAGGYFNNFFAEDYKRFRDSQALAGALAGELQSHAEAVPLIKSGLSAMLATVKSDVELKLPEWPVPASPIFDDNAAKIGLLGAELANGAAYVYENIRAFRGAFHMLSKNHATMPRDWTASILSNCIFTIERAETRANHLVAALNRHACESYWKRPGTKRQITIGLLCVLVFLLVLRTFS